MYKKHNTRVIHIIKVKFAAWQLCDSDSPPSVGSQIQKAIAEPHVKSMMDGEDEILEALEDLGRNIARNDEIIEEQDKALEEKERQIEALRKRLNNSSS